MRPLDVFPLRNSFRRFRGKRPSFCDDDDLLRISWPALEPPPPQQPLPTSGVETMPLHLPLLLARSTPTRCIKIETVIALFRSAWADHRVRAPFRNERADATSLYLLSDIYTQRGLRRIREYIWPFEAAIVHGGGLWESKRQTGGGLPYVWVEIERVGWEMCPVAKLFSLLLSENVYLFVGFDEIDSFDFLGKESYGFKWVELLLKTCRARKECTFDQIKFA